MISPSVLFEDDSYLVIDKPSGISVNRSINEKGETIQDFAISYLHVPLTQKKEGEEDSFLTRSGIVHRIDKETSGILLIAKNENSFKALQSQFLDRTVTKKYICLVHGLLGSPGGTINAPVGRLPWNRRKFGVLPEGRDAVTDYKTLSTYKGTYDKYQMLEMTPHTGRTHQIRIHLKHINHPIVSDPLYAGRKVYRDDLTFCPRLFLHASQITINHPVSNESLTIKCSLPADLEKVLENFKG
ncbi:hypothetical protein A3D77_02635 [Candidatus Gottesmanbacteria bacterium RIFCSPHIGHO2_02_FULL_39_11]|uniref:Pseudouridine synthase n=1 Tax=Candidatus Gottesmanbacteria bacterium RIFCSPHIGHO2_02_FULL_39_11 TaxID=1798382 RepID=A0A1F5ZT02_9BACT|nr:MAG: hypothetical protein A3D77_02635 [Candidatus Gottesmanbacteria bacterium RIFCSPHIGHO2_02_FULL_39_11]